MEIKQRLGSIKSLSVLSSYETIVRLCPNR